MMREVYSLIVIAICITVIVILAFTHIPEVFWWGQIIVQLIMLGIAVDVTMGLIKEREEVGR